MDVLIAIDALDDFIHNAKMAPLSDDVRVDREELLEHAGRLRAGLQAELSVAYRSTSMRMVDDLERIARDAPPVRLFGGVRIGKEQVYDLLDKMRAVIPEEVRLERGGEPAPGSQGLAIALDELDDLLHTGRVVPLSDQVRLDPGALHRAVAVVRAAIEAEITGGDAREVVARLEAIATDAKSVPLSSDVRIDGKQVSDLLDRLRALRH